jgi:hypothetical protein
VIDRQLRQLRFIWDNDQDGDAARNHLVVVLAVQVGSEQNQDGGLETLQIPKSKLWFVNFAYSRIKWLDVFCRSLNVMFVGLFWYLNQMVSHTYFADPYLKQSVVYLLNIFLPKFRVVYLFCRFLNQMAGCLFCRSLNQVAGCLYNTPLNQRVVYVWLVVYFAYP